MSAVAVDSVPATMRASVLTSPGEVGIEDRPVPTAQAGEVLVRIGSVGVCGSDVHYYQHGRIADFVVRQPLVLGHEAGGTIVDVGAGVPSERLGQRVALEPGVPCRVCDQCKHGRYNLCPDVRFLATPPIDGAFAEYLAIAADFAHPIPDSISDDAAGLLEPLSVGIWACQKANVGPGSTVLITGAGPIGILTTQVASAFGATDITVTDVSAERLRVARTFGATRVINVTEDEMPGLSVESYIDCSGVPSAVVAGIRSTAPAGHIVLVGMGADEISIPVGVLQGRELKLTGAFRYANTYPTAIAMAEAGLVDLDALVTATFDLGHVVEALEHSQLPTSMKAIVRPGGLADDGRPAAGGMAASGNLATP
ncbi:NAD(P)-dependent alcohol dehydrogenase [Saxibacter everestensis]